MKEREKGEMKDREEGEEREEGGDKGKEIKRRK